MVTIYTKTGDGGETGLLGGARVSKAAPRVAAYGDVDELNAWFWREGVEADAQAIANHMHGIHFYPTLVVIEKRPMQKPLLTQVGRTPAAGPDTMSQR